MKKTPQHKEIMRDYSCIPFFWNVVQENKRFILVRNWLTGEHRLCRK